MEIPAAELCDRYEALYPGAVTDVLDEMGFGPRALPSAINPLSDDMRLAGLAYPIHGHPDEDCDYEHNLRRFLQMLGEAPEHGILTYQTRDEETAHLGELTATALMAQGCRGAVVDGGVRDTRYILDQEFPVFTRYRTPADAPPRWRLEDWDVPIRIGQVEIRPGDVLIGDMDGIIAVPRQVRETVLERAEAVVDTENEVREAIRDGVDPVSAYDEFGRF